MSNININAEHVSSFVTEAELQKWLPIVLESKRKLLDGTGAGNDYLGWVDLPSTIDVDILSSIKKDVTRMAALSEVVVVIGIGGSYLGARAVIEALQSEFACMQSGKYPYIIYAGHTLSEDYYYQLLQILDHKEYSAIVISKSGTTTEPAVAFRIVKNHLQAKYGKNAAEHIAVITDSCKGALHDIALKEQYTRYVIPDNVGGRFSVLTPVGLLPIAMAGFDIDALLRGAQHIEKICKETNTYEENPALYYAAIRNALYHKGKKVEILENFQPNLRYISEWWKQLYGESEGKDGKGLLPHSLSFTTDLHSMGQYVQEGEHLMFETVINVRQANHSVTLPADAENLDGLNYLLTKSLTEINHCAELGTMQAHEQGGVPVLQINIERVNEEILGELIYFFEFACGVSGYTLGVNPFNQPGVEAYKRNMFHLLGKPGYKD